MDDVIKKIFKIFLATLLLLAGTAPTPSGMSVAAGRKVLIDPYEWPRVLAARKAQRPPTDSWNYDPPWYDDIFTRGEGMHKRMSSMDGGGGEGEDGSMGKRLFVARIGKRMAHGYWARVG